MKISRFPHKKINIYSSEMSAETVESYEKYYKNLNESKTADNIENETHFGVKELSENKENDLCRDITTNITNLIENNDQIKDFDRKRTRNTNTENTTDEMPSKKRKKEFEPPKLQEENRDIFCWRCHKFVAVCDVMPCYFCPRVFHLKCAHIQEKPSTFWLCTECDAISAAENPDKISPTLSKLQKKDLAELLMYVIKRMRQHDGSSHFENPVDADSYPDYKDYIIKPVHLTMLENNVKSLKYASCESFLADTKWMVHNSYIFNTVHSELTLYAKAMMKNAKHECDEIINCPDCYLHANTLDEDKWFIEPCDKPHILVWARLKGFPYWPCKVMKANGTSVDVRFFGDHNKSMVPVDCCYLYSKQMPSKQKKVDELELAIKEASYHIKRLEEKYHVFQYAPLKVLYNPKEEEQQRKILLPYHDMPFFIKVKDKEKLFDPKIVRNIFEEPLPNYNKTHRDEDKNKIVPELLSNEIEMTKNTNIIRNQRDEIASCNPLLINKNISTSPMNKPKIIIEESDSDVLTKGSYSVHSIRGYEKFNSTYIINKSRTLLPENHVAVTTSVKTDINDNDKIGIARTVNLVQRTNNFRSSTFSNEKNQSNYSNYHEETLKALNFFRDINLSPNKKKNGEKNNISTSDKVKPKQSTNLSLDKSNNISDKLRISSNAKLINVMTDNPSLINNYIFKPMVVIHKLTDEVFRDYSSNISQNINVTNSNKFDVTNKDNSEKTSCDDNTEKNQLNLDLLNGNITNLVSLTEIDLDMDETLSKFNDNKEAENFDKHNSLRGCNGLKAVHHSTKSFIKSEKIENEYDEIDNDYIEKLSKSILESTLDYDNEIENTKQNNLVCNSDITNETRELEHSSGFENEASKLEFSHGINSETSKLGCSSCIEKDKAFKKLSPLESENLTCNENVPISANITSNVKNSLTVHFKEQSEDIGTNSITLNNVDSELPDVDNILNNQKIVKSVVNKNANCSLTEHSLRFPDTNEKENTVNEDEISLIKNEKEISSVENENEISLTENEKEDNLTENENLISLMENDNKVNLTENENEINLTVNENEGNLTKNENEINLTENENEVNLMENESEVSLTENENEVNLMENESEVSLTDNEFNSNLAKKEENNSSIEIVEILQSCENRDNSNCIKEDINSSSIKSYNNYKIMKNKTSASDKIVLHNEQLIERVSNIDVQTDDYNLNEKLSYINTIGKNEAEKSIETRLNDTPTDSDCEIVNIVFAENGRKILKPIGYKPPMKTYGIIRKMKTHGGIIRKVVRKGVLLPTCRRRDFNTLKRIDGHKSKLSDKGNVKFSNNNLRNYSRSNGQPICCKKINNLVNYKDKETINPVAKLKIPGEEEKIMAFQIETILNKVEKVDSKGNLKELLREELIKYEDHCKKKIDTIKRLYIEEMDALYNMEKQRWIEESINVCENESKMMEDEIKKKQWCILCLNEAKYHCCWSTSYCSEKCQLADWPIHIKACTQYSMRAGDPDLRLSPEYKKLLQRELEAIRNTKIKDILESISDSQSNPIATGPSPASKNEHINSRANYSGISSSSSNNNTVTPTKSTIYVPKSTLTKDISQEPSETSENHLVKIVPNQTFYISGMASPINQTKNIVHVPKQISTHQEENSNGVVSNNNPIVFSVPISNHNNALVSIGKAFTSKKMNGHSSKDAVKMRRQHILLPKNFLPTKIIKKKLPLLASKNVSCVQENTTASEKTKPLFISMPNTSNTDLLKSNDPIKKNSDHLPGIKVANETSRLLKETLEKGPSKDFLKPSQPYLIVEKNGETPQYTYRIGFQEELEKAQNINILPALISRQTISTVPSQPLPVNCNSPSTSVEHSVSPKRN